MQVKIPNSPRRKALFIIDVQSQTLVPQAKTLIPFMVHFIQKCKYESYVEATYYADEESMFFKQDGFLVSKADAGSTDVRVREAIEAEKAPHILVEKNTRSCFKSFSAAELADFLEVQEIEEAHFIGYDINDCVLASAYDAIDLGYFTYVIEELCHVYDADESLKNCAIEVLRRQNMTNNSSGLTTTLVDVFSD